MNVSKLGHTGKVAEEVLDKVRITANKNTIPFDEEGPFITSGVRNGTAAITSRGFKEKEAKEVAALIAYTLKNIDDEKVEQEVKELVIQLTKQFPLYA